MKPTLEQIKTDESVWPEGATHFVGGYFTKWINNKEYSFKNGAWEKDSDSWKLQQYPDSTVIPRPTKAFVPEVGEWCEYKILGKWYKGFYVGKSIDGRMVMEDEVFPPTKCDDPEEFRPIKSEREKFVEAAMEATGAPASWDGLFEQMYDSGRFKLVEPTK